MMSVRLKKLERGSALRVQRNYLAVESCGFGGQLFYGVDELGVVVVEAIAVRETS
jgi:hypothetical protein